MDNHKLTIEHIEDEGYIRFKVICPGPPCPEVERLNVTDFGNECLIGWELEQIGHEIIRGKSEGQGPWDVKLTYKGSGEDAEAWIDLI